MAPRSLSIALRIASVAPTRRDLLNGLRAAGVALGLVSVEGTVARQRKKKGGGKRAQTCAQACRTFPSACDTCYQRPSGPLLCGGKASADCALRRCRTDYDCLRDPIRPYCTTGFIDRATGKKSSWGCGGVCTDVAACLDI
jgi:hypothetical protein